MDSIAVIYILAGSTFGLILRLFIKYNFRKRREFFFNHLLVVNVLSSLSLGIIIALSITNDNLVLFYFVGFLGCFSTFSSFIYQLFKLIQERKYLRFILYYFEVLILSFLFFCLGYFTTLIFKNWIRNFL